MLTNEEKAQQTKAKWDKRTEKTKMAGGAMMGCGCLLTILITIPIIIFLVFF